MQSSYENDEVWKSCLRLQLFLLLLLILSKGLAVTLSPRFISVYSRTMVAIINAGYNLRLNSLGVVNSEEGIGILE